MENGTNDFTQHLLQDRESQVEAIQGTFESAKRPVCFSSVNLLKSDVKWFYFVP
jgi:hypothetical protein